MSPVPPDRDEMLQVFHALGAACRRARGEPGGHAPPVTAPARRASSGLGGRVQDDELYMSEAVRRRVFEPFFVTKRAGEGAGPGPSVAYSIVTQGHRGPSAVESEEGAGTAFTAPLPASP